MGSESFSISETRIVKIAPTPSFGFLGLARAASRQLIGAQSEIWRQTGLRVSSNRLRRAEFAMEFADPNVARAVHGALSVYRALRAEIESLEQTILAQVKLEPAFEVLRTITGVGPILALTIMLETGEVRRFAGVGNFVSYARCVQSERRSNGKKRAEGNAKSGNKYLSWAFSEAAHYAVRYCPHAKRFYERKRAQRNGIVAIRACAHKLARAAYDMMRDQTAFDAQRLFA